MTISELATEAMILIDDYQLFTGYVNHIVSTLQLKNIHVFSGPISGKTKAGLCVIQNGKGWVTCNSPLIKEIGNEHSVDYRIGLKEIAAHEVSHAIAFLKHGLDIKHHGPEWKACMYWMMGATKISYKMQWEIPQILLGVK